MLDCEAIDSPVGCECGISNNNHDHPRRAGKTRRLYGRTREAAVLSQLYVKCVASTTDQPQQQRRHVDPTALSDVPATISSTEDASYAGSPPQRTSRIQLVALSGPAGVGKRSLAMTLQPLVQEDGGSFVTVSCTFPSCATIIDGSITCIKGTDQQQQHGIRRRRWSRSHQENTNERLIHSALFRALCRMADSVDDEDTTGSFWNDMASESALRASTCFANTATSDWNLLMTILALLLRCRHNCREQIQQNSQDMAPRAGPAAHSVDASFPNFAATGWPNSHCNKDEYQQSCSIMVRIMVHFSTVRPFVLLLQDSHHTDAETWQAIECLVNDSNDAHLHASSKGLLVVLCHRNDVEPAEPVRTLLSHGRTSLDSTANESNLYTITLENLTRDDVHCWVQDDAIRKDSESKKCITDFSDRIYNHGLGNPFVTRYILFLFQADFGPNDDPGIDDDTWWDKLPSDRSSLFQLVLERQDGLVRRVVETVIVLRACDDNLYSKRYGDGNDGSVTASTLETVLQQSCVESLEAAVACGLLMSSDHSGVYQLVSHDLQGAVYAMISESRRAQLHLLIGRRLWKKSTIDLQNETDLTDGDVVTLQTIALHLQRGQSHITDSEERNILALMHWRVGKHAMQSSDFGCAAEHFDSAISILCADQPTWPTDRNNIILTLYNGAAEAHYCTGDFDSMERRLNVIFENAAHIQDKLQAYTTLVFANGSRHRLQEAISIAFNVLGSVGITIPRNPSKMQLYIEYIHTRRLIGRKGDRGLANLPNVTDPTKIATMTLLNFASIYSYACQPEYGAMAMFRLIRLILEWGKVSVAPAAISSYGLLLTTLFGRREEGYRFGQIALDLLNRFGSNAWMPRTYVIVYGPINTWVRPFRESLEPLRFAQQSALQSGDIEGSAISASLYFKVSLYTGMALKVAEQDATAFLRLMESLGQTTGVAFLLPLCSLFHDLSGTSPLDLNLSGSINSVTSAFSLAEKEGNKLFVSFSYLYRTMLYSLTGDHKSSLEAARNFRETSNEADFLVDFYEGLSSLALAREMNSTRSRCTRRRLIANGRQAVQRMTRYAAACPANFRNKQDLLRAELESTLSKSIRAISLYDESIQAAKAEGFVHEEALACERLANYHQRLGHGQAAQAFLGLAREAYLRWGAHTVAARVVEQTTSCKI